MSLLLLPTESSLYCTYARSGVSGHVDGEYWSGWDCLVYFNFTCGSFNSIHNHKLFNFEQISEHKDNSVKY